MRRSSPKGPMTARLGITFSLIGQIFITPLVAFGLTYLLVFSTSGGQIAMSVDVAMIPWIGLASLFYGMLALALALGMGGMTPTYVVERGGWRLALGMTRHPSSSLHRMMARKKYARSAHARLSLLVHERYMEGHPLWTIRGSLILLAIPFQLLLATIPLILVLLFPKGVIRQHHQLELALILYGVCLFFCIRYFPQLARRYITLASIARKLLGSTMKISWVFPVFLLWTMGQISRWVVQRWMGQDLSLNIEFEKEMFESLISASPIPETSFLNLLTALAVMPLAAFTTLSVLGGGAGAPPVWQGPFGYVHEDEGGVEMELGEKHGTLTQATPPTLPASVTPSGVRTQLIGNTVNPPIPKTAFVQTLNDSTPMNVERPSDPDNDQHPTPMTAYARSPRSHTGTPSMHQDSDVPMHQRPVIHGFTFDEDGLKRS